ncbi:MAG: hypothetical protein H6857_05190 [Rhodospirillales bacterium]|nr:hypothetical protein [Rhodospirillales bacterium]
MKIFKILFKILIYTLLVFAALFALGLVILSAFGGNSESWKKRVEEMASAISGAQVQIGTLHDARLFPDLMFDGEYVLFTKQLESGAFGGDSFLVRKLQFSLPFWSVFWGNPIIERFHVEGVTLLGYDGYTLDAAKLIPEAGRATLSLDGQYNKVTYHVDIPLERSGAGYRVPRDVQWQGGLDETVTLSGRSDAMQEETVSAKGDGRQHPFARTWEVMVGDHAYQGTFGGEGAAQEFVLSKEHQPVLRILPMGTVVVKEAADSAEEPVNAVFLKNISDPDFSEILRIACRLSDMDYLQIQMMPDIEQPQLLSCRESPMPEELSPAIIPAVPAIPVAPAAEVKEGAGDGA